MLARHLAAALIFVFSLAYPRAAEPAAVQSVPSPAPTTNELASQFQAYVISHTHSDFAWADSMAGCLDKNVAAVAKSVELARTYPDFRFCMEHMLAVREYLQRNPDQLGILRQLMNEGRFEAGGFYTGPWELTSGAEALVRQLYFGKLWVQKTLGISPTIVWNVDVAGHTAQLPQILHKAGIKGLVISAGSSGPNLINWLARDGSGVLTWRTPWGYSASDALGLRHADLKDTIVTMPKYVADVLKNCAEYRLPPIGFIADGTDIQAPTAQVVENIRRWNTEKRFPPVTYSSSAALFASIENTPLPAFAGEMPSPWDSVQSQGNECFMADRRLDERVLAAEKFAAFASVFDPGFNYPREQLEKIWQLRLYTFDHNWGGSHGKENNDLKADNILQASRLTEAVLEQALSRIAGAIDLKKPTADAVPVVIFNPFSWLRKDVVTCQIPDPGQQFRPLKITDQKGRPVPGQVVRMDETAAVATVVFVAEVPSLGYATYYAAWDKAAPTFPSPFTAAPASHTYENAFYRLQFDPASGGIKSLWDKRADRELIRQNSQYTCNELVAIEDDDIDIGVHLTGKEWRSRAHPSTIQVLENGPVRMVIQVTGKLLDSSSRQQQIVLYADLPKIDLVTSLGWEGKRNVQLYQVFPFNVSEPRVRYAIPYGWEEYGQEMKYAAPWFSHSTPPVAQHRWRGVRGWTELANADTQVTLASQCNFAAFKDLSAQPEPGFLIQPMLLRTVRSCGDGGKQFYEQKGQHEFRFSLQGEGDPTHLGAELDCPLLTCIPKGSTTKAPSLPERLSFLQVDSRHVQVAVVKQAEDGSDLVVRVVELNERQKETQTQLKFFRQVRNADRTSIIEEPEQKLDPRGDRVTVRLAPAGIETLRVALERE